MNAIKHLFCSFVLLLAAQTIKAEPIGQNYAISIFVEPKCTVNTTDIHFGTIDLINHLSSYEKQINVNILCVKDTPYEVSISSGNSGSQEGYRKLKLIGGQDFINYELLSSQRTPIGEGFGNKQKIYNTGTGYTQYIPVIAQIPSGQKATPGTYQDSLVLSVSY